MNNQDLMALSLKMERIEKKYPQTFRENARWQELNSKREKLTRKLMEQELQYHREKAETLAWCGGGRSAKLVGQYEKYLKRYEQGVENGNDETKN